MKAFIIDTENAITAFASAAEAKEALTEGAVLFTTEEELAREAESWPTARLLELWNSVPGIIPVKKFTNRAVGIQRIWKVIQHLEPAPPPQPQPVKAEEAPAVRAPRDGTKRATVLEMLAREEGATVKEIMAALGWQSHSVRGFLSNLNKSGTTLQSCRRADGARAYSTAAANPKPSGTEGEQ